LGLLQRDPIDHLRRRGLPTIKGAMTATLDPVTMQASGTVGEPDHQVEAAIAARLAARKARNWSEADRIRDELKAQGIILEDRTDGTTDWRRA
ncbi:MAG: hypothetical protein ACK5PI_02770, partial [Acetobacteraceae bacterium]